MQLSSPRHVWIVINGSWAKNRVKLRIFGHKEGINSVLRAVSFAVSHQFDALTLYAFISENLKRTLQEVSAGTIWDGYLEGSSDAVGGNEITIVSA